MSTRVFLVRHGVTSLVAEDRFAGDTDVELSEEGREQARRLGGRLAHESIAAVYASPKSRTMETARLAYPPLRERVVPEAGLREISHGHWEQLRRSDVAERFPAEYACWEQDPFTFAPAGGESGLAVTARALPCLLRIVADHPDQSVLVVSHKATIRLLISSLLGFDPRTYRDRLDQSPACLNILDFKDVARARLMLFNDVSHYADAPSRAPDAPSAQLSSWWDETKR